MEQKNVVKVVTTLNSGAAKPIAISKEQAQNLAQQQSLQLEEKREEQIRQLKIKEGEVTTEQPVINKRPEINRKDLSIETQAAVEDLYSEKVLYKVVEQKTNWNLVLIMLLVLLIIIIVIVAELSILK